MGLTPAKLEQWREWSGQSRLSLSMDGPPHIHDGLRVDRRGRGSYSQARQAAELLKAQGGLEEVNASLTAAYPQVTEIHEHLFGLEGSKVLARPVQVPPDHPLAFTEDNVGVLLAGTAVGGDSHLFPVGGDSHLFPAARSFTPSRESWARLLPALRPSARTCSLRACPEPVEGVNSADGVEGAVFPRGLHDRAHFDATPGWQGDSHPFPVAPSSRWL